MSEKIPFYWYPYAASVATAEDPDYVPPEEEEADEDIEGEGEVVVLARRCLEVLNDRKSW